MTTATPTRISRLRCIHCGHIADRADQDFRCPNCHDLFEVFFLGWQTSQGLRAHGHTAAELKSLWLERRARLEPESTSGVWRFRELLPALNDGHHPITLREGNTPLYDLPRCAQIARIEHLQAKHQGMNPTASFKDTGMTTAASFARQEGFRWVACASTGNTSASMAAYAARGGMRSLVLIPEGKISWGKLSQALDYGAVTCQLRTDFDGCMRILNEVVRRMPVYLLNSVNPYRLEGQKTAAIELLEQHGRELVPMQADTLATAIRIGNPASWKKALKVVQATEGTVEQVGEVEIALAKAEIGSDGVGCEPASAVTLAGLKKLVRSGFVKGHESVVLILTGHVLKDPEFTLKFHRGDLFTGTAHEKEASLLAQQQRAPLVLDATVDAVVQTLKQLDS